MENKVIVVTGGAGLLGSAFVKSITDQGWQAVIADVDHERAENIICDYEKNECENPPFYVELDINNEASVIKSIDTILDKFDKVDALINNAYPRNKNYGKHFFDVKYKDFCENIDMNLGTFVM